MILSITGAWFYFIHLPQLKIEQLKEEAQKRSDSIDVKYTYLDHLKDKDKKELSYLVLGDSVAKGQKVKGENFSEIVKRKIELETGTAVVYENLGVSKRTSDELLQEFYKPEFREKVRKADVISLNIGGNDLVKIALRKGKLEAIKEYPGIKEQYESNIGQILRMIHVQNEDVIVLVNELYNVVDPSESFYPATKKLLLDWNLVAYQKSHIYQPTLVVPISDILSPEDKESWLADQIHPNELGHQLISDQIMGMLSLNYSK